MRPDSLAIAALIFALASGTSALPIVAPTAPATKAQTIIFSSAASATQTVNPAVTIAPRSDTNGTTHALAYECHIS